MRGALSACDTGYQIGRLIVPLVCCGAFLAMLALTVGSIASQMRRNRMG